ncbi:MAG: hypothetical protein K2W96_28790, partial [Gemmataceae bacterium]|nr:hypothetical protein [Gemmataceae bacterium]
LGFGRRFVPCQREEPHGMQLLMLNGAALAIALLYASWRLVRHHDERQRKKVIRERVALLLWTVAQQGASPAA